MKQSFFILEHGKFDSVPCLPAFNLFPLQNDRTANKGVQNDKSHNHDSSG